MKKEKILWIGVMMFSCIIFFFSIYNLVYNFKNNIQNNKSNKKTEEILSMKNLIKEIKGVAKSTH